MREETIGRRAAAVVDQQRAEMRKHLGAALDGRDPEGVHDMRVASRRLRACLQLFSPWIDERELGRVEPGVRAATRALGRVRELDVLRLRLAELSRRASPSRALAIEALDAQLADRRRRARTRMMARFAKVGLDRLDHRLQRLVAHLETSGKPRAAGASERAAHAGADLATDAASGVAREPGAGGEAAGASPPGAAANDGPSSADAAGTAGSPPAGATATPSADAPTLQLVAVAAPQIMAAAHEAMDLPIPDEIATPAAAEALHQVRIAAKKLRYLLEVVAPDLGDAGGRLVKRLKGLQDRLGDFHDDTVLDETVCRAIERGAERGRKRMASELRRFRALRRRALVRDERAVREALAALRERRFVEEIAGALLATGVPAERVGADAIAAARASKRRSPRGPGRRPRDRGAALLSRGAPGPSHAPDGGLVATADEAAPRIARRVRRGGAASVPTSGADASVVEQGGGAHPADRAAERKRRGSVRAARRAEGER